MKLRGISKKISITLGGLDSLVRNLSCSEFGANNVVLSQLAIDGLVPIVGYEPFPLNELLLMTASICRVRPTCLSEWGTHMGKWVRVFMESSKGFDLNCEIHSIDLPDDVVDEEHPGRRRGELVIEFPEVRLHQGDEVSTALRITRSIDARGGLLFFLDGDHSYDSVLRELTLIVEAWPTASILIHDTVYQSAEAGYNIGPFEAVKEILNRSSNSFKVLTVNTALPGMTLLWRA